MSLGFPIIVSKNLIELAYIRRIYYLKDGIKKLYGLEIAKEEFTWIDLVTICKHTLDREPLEKEVSSRIKNCQTYGGLITRV